MWQTSYPEFNMPVAYGKNGKEAGLDGQIINAKKLEAIANK